MRLATASSQSNEIVPLDTIAVRIRAFAIQVEVGRDVIQDDAAAGRPASVKPDDELALQLCEFAAAVIEHASRRGVHVAMPS